MITHWHIPIMGFTQDVRSVTGMERLWLKLRRSTGAVGPTRSLVHPQEWRADFEALAEFMLRCSEYRNADVTVVAYSWGGGHGFVRLARELDRRGVTIDRAILCDPVYHSWIRPWRGMVSWKWNPPVVVPENVGEVFWFYQRRNVPQASGLVAEGETVIHDGVELACDHNHADDQAEFHDLVLSLVPEHA